MLNNDLRLSAIILAAGYGTRVKRLGPKPLLIFNKQTFIENIYNKLVLAGISNILIITNSTFFPKITELVSNTTIRINPNPDEGMLSSLKIGIKNLQKSCQGFIMNPVDFPLVDLETYNGLVETFKLNTDKIIKPSYNGKSGHPVIFPASLFNELQNAPLSEGARYVTRKFPHQSIFMETQDIGVIKNINTIEAYNKYCR